MAGHPAVPEEVLPLLSPPPPHRGEPVARPAILYDQTRTAEIAPDNRLPVTAQGCTARNGRARFGGHDASDLGHRDLSRNRQRILKNGLTVRRVRVPRG